MEIRPARYEDVDTLMDLFSYARDFMTKTGNAYQWGHNSWPWKEVILQDIEKGKSFVVVEGSEILGTFFLNVGENPEPCYDHVEGGHWNHEGPYAVIHRIASSGKAKGILKAAVEFASSKCPHIRIDTHEDNRVMRDALTKLGFAPIGFIYVDHDTVRRIAFERFGK